MKTYIRKYKVLQYYVEFITDDFTGSQQKNLISINKIKSIFGVIKILINKKLHKSCKKHHNDQDFQKKNVLKFGESTLHYLNISSTKHIYRTETALLQYL